MPLTVPVFTKIPNLLKELIRIVPNITFHEVLSPDTDKFFKNSDVIICDFDYFGPHLYDMLQLKWIQGTWAGVDLLTKYIEPNKVLPPYQITRYTGQHFGRIMGEYVLTNIVNFERSLFRAKENQEKCEWLKEDKIQNYRVVYDLTVGILGLGNIGSRIGKLLDFCGAKVVAYGRRSQLPSDGDYTYLTQYYSGNQLAEFLSQCDYIVNVLPNTPETTNLLDNDVLKNCRERGAVFMNIGRGNIITEDSIIKAIENKWISGAILDVFSQEPLPKENKLWRMPQVFITPHVAGVSRAQDIAQQFRDNYELYLRNLPLPGVVDLRKGY